MIVSVSRRCDIPRFQFEWFMEQLNAGFVETVNPYNSRQVRRVSLKPDEAVFVFWTRDPQNILDNADELTNRGFRFYVMVTVTGYPLALEPGMVRTSKALRATNDLARKIGPDRVIWRYDPILLSSVTDENFHRKNFKTITHNLEGSVKRVIISIYDEYRGAKQRLDAMEKMGILRLTDIDPAGLLTDMAKSAEEAGIEIQSCARKEDYSPYGIMPGACIDPVLIGKLWALETSGKDKNQRPNCLCCQSVDIGSYRLCSAKCVYCYAW